jgi:DNA-binding NarL/FixJ family response regulator
MKVTTIVIADDHDAVRQCVGTLLDSEPDLNVIGEAVDGNEVIRLLERLQPDVLVTDIIMPGKNGLEVTREASKISPNTNVVILSIMENDAYVFEAQRAGAKAYVLKKSGSLELLHAIREASAGRSYLAPPLSIETIEAYVNKLNSDKAN